MPIINDRQNNRYDRFFRLVTEMLHSQQGMNRNIQTLQQIYRENIVETTNLNYEILDLLREYISLERDNEIIHALGEDRSSENRSFFRNLLSRSEGERIRRHHHEEQLSQHSFTNTNPSYYSGVNARTQPRAEPQRTTRTPGQNTRTPTNRGDGINFFDLIQRSSRKTTNKPWFNTC